jgi:DNA-binding YbaB/EbfC family protein
MTNFAQMMQKAQKFKQKMQELQDRAHQVEVQGEAGQGLVRCSMTGKHELKSIKIDPSVIKPGEADVMEDLIVAAVNDALARAQKVMTDETGKLMQEMGLPPNMDLPF